MTKAIMATNEYSSSIGWTEQAIPHLEELGFTVEIVEIPEHPLARKERKE